jgi:hypothetical protein
VGIGCFCATNVYSDGAVNWVTVERERELNACLAEKRGIWNTYGYMVYVCSYASV